MRRPEHYRSSLGIVALVVALPMLQIGNDARAELDPAAADHVAASTVLLSIQIVEEIDGQKRVSRDCALGSGSIITSNGVILTNHHVLIDGLDRAESYAETRTQEEDDPAITYSAADKIGVWMVDSGGQTPIRRYSAEPLPESAPHLDLALARIVGDAHGVEYPDRQPRSQLEFLSLGDSDPRTWPSDDITIHGYPLAESEDNDVSTPGCTDLSTLPDETIQRSRGEFSGSQPDDVGETQLIFATGTVWFGNSGGSAVNDRGELVGVPTRFEARGGGSRVILVPINRATSFLSDVVPELPVAGTPPAAASTGTPPPATATATDSATPESASTSFEGSVIYRDGFDDPLSSWLATNSDDPSSRQYRFDNGEYVIDHLDAGNTWSSRLINVGSYSDISVAVDARLSGEPEDRVVFVACRGTEQGWYRLDLWPADAFFLLSRLEEGEYTTLARGERQDAIATDTATNRLELRCIGTEITVIVNGTEVARVDDDNLRQGGLSMGTGRLAEAPPGTVQARFDNLEVAVPREATGTPTTVDADILYSDDFDNPDVSWLNTVSPDEDVARYSFAEGEYVIEKTDSEHGPAINRRLPGTYRDVVMTVDARLAGETELRFVTLTCRENEDDEQYSSYRLTVWPARTSFQLSRDRNEASESVQLAFGVRQDAIAPGGGTNRLELRCIGTEITVIVNGTEVARVDDEILSEGTVSFGTGVFSSGLPDTVAAHFDDLVIAVP